VLLSALSPGYLLPLVTQGSFLLVVGAVLMLVGWAWTRRLIRPQF
jgi:Flp pilus assembly protein TadB